MTNFTDILKLSLQETGENPNTWGDVANIVFTKTENAVAGTHTINVTTGLDITLTSTNGVTDEASNMILNLNGAPTANIDVIVPNKSKLYVVDATNMTGSFSVTIKATGGSGASFNTGDKGLVYCDGTDTKIMAQPSTVGVPSGIIAMWSGTISTIPSGWSLCNGAGVTPDLRGKFIIGANADDGSIPTTDITGSATTTGGSKDLNFTSSAGGDHDHGGTSGSHALTVPQIPAHDHEGVFSAIASGVSGSFITMSNLNFGSGNLIRTANTGGGEGHSHTISTSGTHTHNITSTNGNLPPYYALAYIMKD